VALKLISLSSGLIQALRGCSLDDGTKRDSPRFEYKFMVEAIALNRTSSYLSSLGPICQHEKVGQSARKRPAIIALDHEEVDMPTGLASSCLSMRRHESSSMV
jgi:hypothetical protein